MYTNIGEKIKVMAQLLGWLGGIGGGVAGLIMMLVDEKLLLTGVIVFMWGLLSFVFSWPLYGFGELVDNAGILRKKVEQMAVNANRQPSSAPAGQPAGDELPNL